MSLKFKQQLDTKVNLTTDAWTSVNNVAFLGVTAHWLNSDFEHEEIILDFIHLKGSHTGENLADAIYSVLKDFNIIDKVRILLL
jgi:hypothetical protein